MEERNSGREVRLFEALGDQDERGQALEAKLEKSQRFCVCPVNEPLVSSKRGRPFVVRSVGRFVPGPLRCKKRGEELLKSLPVILWYRIPMSDPQQLEVIERCASPRLNSETWGTRSTKVCVAFSEVNPPDV
jgi:hypothetical protein